MPKVHQPAAEVDFSALAPRPASLNKRTYNRTTEESPLLAHIVTSWESQAAMAIDTTKVQAEEVVYELKRAARQAGAGLDWAYQDTHGNDLPRDLEGISDRKHVSVVFKARQKRQGTGRKRKSVENPTDSATVDTTA